MNKTYKNLVSQNYGISLTVNGDNVHVNFSGGRRFPVFTYGKYSTSNPDIQKALESHHLYGKDWTLDETPAIIQEEVVIEPIQPVQEDEGRIVKTTVTTQNARIVLEPKNVQQAKEWLNKNMSIPYSKMKLRDHVFNVAEELKIDFINVEKT
jgi:hypothetical protein